MVVTLRELFSSIACVSRSSTSRPAWLAPVTLLCGCWGLEGRLVYGWGSLGGGCLRGLSLLLLLLLLACIGCFDDDEAAGMGMGLIPPNPFVVLIDLIDTASISSPTPIPIPDPPCLIPEGCVGTICCRGEGEVALPFPALCSVLASVDGGWGPVYVMGELSGESL